MRKRCGFRTAPWAPTISYFPVPRTNEYTMPASFASVYHHLEATSYSPLAGFEPDIYYQSRHHNVCEGRQAKHYAGGGRQRRRENSINVYPSSTQSTAVVEKNQCSLALPTGPNPHWQTAFAVRTTSYFVQLIHDFPS